MSDVDNIRMTNEQKSQDKGMKQGPPVIMNRHQMKRKCRCPVRGMNNHNDNNNNNNQLQSHRAGEKDTLL